MGWIDEHDLYTNKSWSVASCPVCLPVMIWDGGWGGRVGGNGDKRRV